PGTTAMSMRSAETGGATSRAAASSQPTIESSRPGANSRPASSGTNLSDIASRPARIVRALAGDGDVVGVALVQAGAGDAHELGLGVQLGERAGADIAHGGAQAAGELVQHGRGRALVRHLAFDPFRHQLERVLDVLLEVAVGRAARHGADRAHAAIGLVGAALIEEHLARRL